MALIWINKSPGELPVNYLEFYLSRTQTDIEEIETSIKTINQLCMALNLSPKARLSIVIISLYVKKGLKRFKNNPR
jgi:hypothetical protein